MNKLFYLIVMDNSTMEVHAYPTNLDPKFHFNDQYEDQVIQNKHNLSEVSWMVVENLKLIVHSKNEIS